MASHWFNEGKRAVLAGEIQFATDDIRAALCMLNTTADSVIDGAIHLSDLTLDECDGAGYSRQALANKTVTRDDTNDLAVFDADDESFGSIGASTRNVQGVLIYLHVTNDADSVPLFWLEFSTSKVPDGSDFTVRWSASGLTTCS